MRKFILAVIAVVFVTACSSSDKKAVEIAENFTLKTFGPRYPSSTILPDCAEPGVHRINDLIDKLRLINSLDSIYTTSYDDYWKRVQKGYTPEPSKEKYRAMLIDKAVNSAEIAALQKADATEGFYTVSTCLQYRDSAGNEKVEHFSIVVSKNYRVLNTPPNLKSIDSTVNAVYKED